MQVKWLPKPKTNENHVEIFMHLEHAVSSFHVFSKVLFLQISVRRGILSVLLAGIFSSHRDVENEM